MDTLGSVRPSLPWELILHIVALADPPTLALLSRTSYDLLVAASPFLYHSVALSSRVQIERFLCSTPESADSSYFERTRLTSHLSLHQVFHLTLDYSTLFAHPDAPLPSYHRLIPHSRLSTPSLTLIPLPLASLTIILHPATASSAIHVVRTELLSHFNPSTYSISILPTPPITHATVWHFLSDPYSAPRDLTSWTRLRRLVLRGVLPFAIGPPSGSTHEVVLDMRGGEWNAGAGGLEMMRLGTRMSPLGRVKFGRRLVLMGMGGSGGEGSEGWGRVVLRVGKGDGTIVRGEIQELEGAGWEERLYVEEADEGKTSLQ